jgi:hypothetical protein
MYLINSVSHGHSVRRFQCKSEVRIVNFATSKNITVEHNVLMLQHS